MSVVICISIFEPTGQGYTRGLRVRNLSIALIYLSLFRNSKHYFYGGSSLKLNKKNDRFILCLSWLFNSYSTGHLKEIEYAQPAPRGAKGENWTLPFIPWDCAALGHLLQNRLPQPTKAAGAQIFLPECSVINFRSDQELILFESVLHTTHLLLHLTTFEPKNVQHTRVYTKYKVLCSHRNTILLTTLSVPRAFYPQLFFQIKVFQPWTGNLKSLWFQISLCQLKLVPIPTSIKIPSAKLLAFMFW